MHYLRASSDALHGNGTAQGTYYAVEYGIDINNGSWLKIYRRHNDTLTLLASSAMAWRSSGTAQSVITANGTILVYLDGVLMHKLQDSVITSGKPGVGGWWYGGGGSPRQLGPLDRIAPSNPSIQAAAFSNYVDLQWGPAADDANGSGVFAYEIYRNGVFLAEIQTRGFTDTTVSPGTAYSYTVRARDRHNNLASGASVNVTTLQSGQTDARRTGVRPEGTYWGGAGEQIDMRSGNLTYSLPLVSGEGRNGWRVRLGLVYNSQNWRKDSAQWKLGQDVGYGFGWRLMVGSLTPMMSSSLAVHHWIFTDASGAEYRLDLNSGGIWTSKESVYVRYDANQQKLFGPDGTTWYMDCVSAQGEEDGGTRYPTQIEDTPGNYIRIRYQLGKEGFIANSSARIKEIEDVRVNGAAATYTFTYNADATPHLTQITNSIATAENYTFSYTTPATLYSPFSPQQSFGTTQFLQTATLTGIGLSHTFEYCGNGAGELTKVIFPFQGELRWVYQDFAYAGGLTYREVSSRSLVKQSGGAVSTYPISHPSRDSALSVHSETTLDDAGGVGRRVWTFQTALGYSQGLATKFEQQQLPGATVKTRAEYTWTQDSVGRPYVQAV